MLWDAAWSVEAEEGGDGVWGVLFSQESPGTLCEMKIGVRGIVTWSCQVDRGRRLRAGVS